MCVCVSANGMHCCSIHVCGGGSGWGGGVYNYCHVGDHTSDGCSGAVYNSSVRQKSSAGQQQLVMHVGVLIQLVC